MGCAGGRVGGGTLGGSPILHSDAFRHRADIEIVGILHLTAFLFPSFPLRILSGGFVQHHCHSAFAGLHAFLPRPKPRGAIETPGVTPVLCGRASTVLRLSPVRPASIGIISLRPRLAGPLGRIVTQRFAHGTGLVPHAADRARRQMATALQAVHSRIRSLVPMLSSPLRPRWVMRGSVA
ncbi:hypothetical protein BV379_16600 [Rhodovulum sulfidophilum]|nr:hypothetical protein BV379_16600 [Rhodovulum sulfidophilum]